MKEKGALGQCTECELYIEGGAALCGSCARESPSEFFHVYILKLRDANGRIDFYAGQTNDLLVRLTEHQDGLTKTTAGKNPCLVWFHPVDGREKALEAEKELQAMIRETRRTAHRPIRQMVSDFQSLARELCDL